MQAITVWNLKDLGPLKKIILKRTLLTNPCIIVKNQDLKSKSKGKNPEGYLKNNKQNNG